MQMQPEQLRPAMEPLIAYMSSDDQELQENATGALANLAGHPTLQSWFTEPPDPLGLLLKPLLKGSPLAHDNCARALDQLAACHVPNHKLCQFPVLAALGQLLTNPATNVQLASLRILQKLFDSWLEDDLRCRRVSTCDAQSQAYQAIQQFINRRGLVALRFLLQKPDTEDPAAVCLSCLAPLKLSWPAIASSGSFQLLLQRLALPGPPWESKAAITRRPVAHAVAILVKDADCAKLALQPANLKVILQLLQAASMLMWESALQMLFALIRTDENRQTFAAAGLLDASLVESILFDTEACFSSATAVMQAQVILDISRMSSYQQALADGGGIKHLSRKLDSPCTEVQMRSARTLSELSADDAAIRQRCTEGNIPVKLVRLLHSGEENVQLQAATALLRLAISQHNEGILADLGSLLPLIKLLSSTSPELKIRSACAIRNICFSFDANRLQASQLGALPPLIAMSTSKQLDVKKAGQECLDRLAQTAAVKQQIQALQCK